MDAAEMLQRAADLMIERGRQYDKRNGERSMTRAVEAFNAVTGHDLKESDGWLLMVCLKMVRSETTDAPHADSLHDLVAYSSLFAESRMTCATNP